MKEFRVCPNDFRVAVGQTESRRISAGPRPMRN